MSEYSFIWTCADCGKDNQNTLTKHQAAFFDSLRHSFKCEVCSSEKRSSSSHAMPEIDDELLSAWLDDESLQFMSQDEDLIMTDIPTTRLIKVIDQSSSMRAAQLFKVLCVKLYDENFSTQDERNETILFLEKNQKIWKKMNVWPYIQKGVKKKLRRQKSFFGRLFNA